MWDLGDWPCHWKQSRSLCSQQKLPLDGHTALSSWSWTGQWYPLVCRTLWGSPCPFPELRWFNSPRTWWKTAQTNPAKSFGAPSSGSDPIAEEWVGWCIWCSPAALQGSLRIFLLQQLLKKGSCWRLYYKEYLLLPLGGNFVLLMLRYKGMFLVHFLQSHWEQEWATEQEGHFVTESKPTAQH